MKQFPTSEKRKKRSTDRTLEHEGRSRGPTTGARIRKRQTASAGDKPRLPHLAHHEIKTNFRRNTMLQEDGDPRGPRQLERSADAVPAVGFRIIAAWQQASSAPDDVSRHNAATPTRRPRIGSSARFSSTELADFASICIMAGQGEAGDWRQEAGGKGCDLQSPSSFPPHTSTPRQRLGPFVIHQVWHPVPGTDSFPVPPLFASVSHGLDAGLFLRGPQHGL